MYVSRNIDRALQEWSRAKKRKPLLLRGVRQCGKTSSVRHLAERFSVYAEINFEKQTGLKAIFEGDLDPKRILERLEVEVGKRLRAGEALLFFDEIQTCPRAITALRYFYEELPELHIIAAGSLLEFVLQNPKGQSKIEFPVGRVRSMFLYPFSFSEYLRGMGKELLADSLAAMEWMPERNDLHEKLLEEYKTFLVVGGMPEAVVTYLESGSLVECQRVHRDMLMNFKDDFEKYGSEISPDILRRVFDYAIHHVCGQTKASAAISGVSAYHFDACVKLLRRAGLIYPVKASSCETLPLGSGEKETNKKLLFFDTGMYLTECRLNVGGLLAAEVFSDINKGDVAEMQTGLELIKNSDPYTETEVYYWYRSGANAEVDYVIQRENAIIPVEVKASVKGGMQSIRSFLNTHPDSPYGIRISMENFAAYEKIRVFPLYMAGRLTG